jgi:prolyl oligopeptidase
MGAALTQRPELFKAVYCAVPVLDMVRYANFESAKFWVSEFGDPEIKEEFDWLYSYSPYHHVKSDVRYPAVYLKASDGDRRTDPLHALKMTAMLQSKTKSNIDQSPIILWVQSQTGHGAGKTPIDQTIEATSKSYSFLAHHVGLDLTKSGRK